MKVGKFNIPIPGEKLYKRLFANVEAPKLPIQGGRESVPEFSDGISTVISQLDFIIQPEFDLRLLAILEDLAAFNHDVGYAVDNIVSLANTEETIEFDADISDELRTQALEHLMEKRECWYNFSDGNNSMNNDFLTQLAITGAISGEFVVANDLSGIDQIVRVNPKNVRFMFDKENETFIPIQHKGVLGLRSVDAQGFIVLNPTTYRYIAMRRFRESPYALPLFLTALESIVIQRDMLKNLGFVMKKLGLLGFMEVLMDVPERQQNESQSQFDARVINHLKKGAEEASKGMATGLVVGFKGKHEFKHNEVKGDSNGADKIYNLNERNVVSGLKQPGELLGKDTKTGETFGRVLLAKFSSQVENFQKAYGSFKMDAYNLELRLAGFAVDNIVKEVKFERPMLGDAVREQTAWKLKIDNLNNLFIDGVISQETRAQRLGEEVADQEEPRASRGTSVILDDNDSSDPSNPSNDDDATDPKTTENALKAFEDADDAGKQILIKYFANELGAGAHDPFDEECSCGDCPED